MSEKLVISDTEEVQDNTEKLLTPQEYFELVKGKKQKITDEDLVMVYENCLELLSKYKITGQQKGMRKLLYHLECIEKEREIVKLGVDTFIYRDDIEEYIDTIAKDTVKIIELERYEREIPDEIVEVIAQVKDKFDQLYVVFTDYTGKVERQVEKERRAKDPILFGTFQDVKNRVVIDRFYYLGDWEDEYCDLTLDKMVNECLKVGKRNITKTISTPKDIAELREQLAALEEKGDSWIVDKVKLSKPTFFSKVKTVLNGNKNEK